MGVEGLGVQNRGPWLRRWLFLWDGGWSLVVLGSAQGLGSEAASSQPQWQQSPLGSFVGLRDGPGRRWVESRAPTSAGRQGLLFPNFNHSHAIFTTCPIFIPSVPLLNFLYQHSYKYTLNETLCNYHHWKIVFFFLLVFMQQVTVKAKQ